MEADKRYTVHPDKKKRITIRGAAYEYYEVTVYSNGCIMLEPRVIGVPGGISEETLRDMDKAVENYRNGTLPEPLDLSKLDSMEISQRTLKAMNEDMKNYRKGIVSEPVDLSKYEL